MTISAEQLPCPRDLMPVYDYWQLEQPGLETLRLPEEITSFTGHSLWLGASRRNTEYWLQGLPMLANLQNLAVEGQRIDGELVDALKPLTGLIRLYLACPKKQMRLLSAGSK